MTKTILVSLLILCTTVSSFAQTMTIHGTAVDEAVKPYTAYTVQLRNIQTGQVEQITPLTTTGEFGFLNLANTAYTVELLNSEKKVVCTEGPVRTSTTNMHIDCGKIPAAWWLVAAAGAASITAGVVATNDASPSR